MRKLARLLEDDKTAFGTATAFEDEKAGWDWLRADEGLVRFLVDNPDLYEARVQKALDGLVPDTREDAEKLVHKLWRLAAVAAAFLNGGRARKENYGMADQDPEQRVMGIEVEAEHTCPDARKDIRALIQGRIGRDHNAEDEKYYYRSADGAAKVKGEK